ncbi:hypothetical protein F5148DRAFT_1145794 [Russula earlei]|uniref:Uncharacterized protein n=1 Tax=Russula earlei TaxID=71964 RepID=A0ACC0UP00_9AGAM|nr:hypothetical protein F5148DRAFT_1145794 [Russula earlei]
MRFNILFLSIFGAFVNVQGFHFTSTKLTQCGQLNVSWTGGQPPFVLTIVPVHGTPIVFNLNASTISNGVGSFVARLSLALNRQFLLVMSDATGFATGGISPLMTVQPPMPGDICNLTQPSPDFLFTVDPTLQQCRPFGFYSFSNAIQPVKIYGVVPGGRGTVLNPPTGPLFQFVWKAASVPADTSILFYMSDARNRRGGVSDILVSGSTADASCLNLNSPSSIASSTNAPARATATSAAGPQAKKGSNGPRPEIIIGAVIGLTILFTGLVLVLVRLRKREGSTPSPRRPNDIDEDFRKEPALLGQVDPFPPPSTTDISHEMTRLSSSGHVKPLPLPDDQVVPEPDGALLSSVSLSGPRTSNTPPPRSPSPSTRVLVHRDAEELVEEDGIIELPPEYDENRRPLVFHVAPNDTPS